ncbi:MAG TPA: aldo/keto reductase [Candidatus Lokiarchaeia archaeon]|nr:aldo/keto reductase [Candidatus Lokiarchaeia archaeon]
MGSRIDWTEGVSALGFGCMRLPTKKTLFIKKIDEPEAIKIIRHAIDNGVNYVDTAYMYHGGKSEIVVGKALKEGYREKVHLVTKLPVGKVKSANDVEKLCREQLAKLQTSCLDIYLFHGLNKNAFQKVKDLNLIDEMEKLKAAGLIKHYGFSFHDNLQVFKEIIDFHDWDACQIQYNYLDQDSQATTQGLEYAASKGVAVIIMEPLKGGRLANPTQEVSEIFGKAEVKRSPVDWALQFVWNHPEVSVVLSGMSSFDQVKQNLDYASNSGPNTLSDAELDTLKQVSEVFKKAIVIPCTACEYCMPCPSGVAIPRHFAILNRLADAPDKKMALKFTRRMYKELAATKDALNDAKDNGMAKLCTKCKQCMEKCPQGIDIPAELEKINSIIEGKGSIEKLYPRME